MSEVVTERAFSTTVGRVTVRIADYPLSRLRVYAVTFQGAVVFEGNVVDVPEGTPADVAAMVGLIGEACEEGVIPGVASVVTASACAEGVNPFTFAPPSTEAETVAFANAHGYEWGYLDTCREISEVLVTRPVPVPMVDPVRVPDGWPYAWLEHNRRVPSRMAIREAFRMWRDTGSLPGLDAPAKVQG